MLKVLGANSLRELIVIVSRMGSDVDAHEEGPEVMRIALWDGRFVVASWHNGCDEEEIDVDDRNGSLPFDQDVEPYVRKLVEEGTPFVTEADEGEERTTLRWTITVEEGPAS